MRDLSQKSFLCVFPAVLQYLEMCVFCVNHWSILRSPVLWVIPAVKRYLSQGVAKNAIKYALLLTPRDVFLYFFTFVRFRRVF